MQNSGAAGSGPKISTRSPLPAGHRAGRVQTFGPALQALVERGQRLACRLAPVGGDELHLGAGRGAAPLEQCRVEACQPVGRDGTETVAVQPERREAFGHRGERAVEQGRGRDDAGLGALPHRRTPATHPSVGRIAPQPVSAIGTGLATGSGSATGSGPAIGTGAMPLAAESMTDAGRAPLPGRGLALPSMPLSRGSCSSPVAGRGRRS